MPLRFQTFEEQQREEEAILAQHADGWRTAFSEYDAVNAALSSDTETLAKMGKSEVSLAKAEADRLRKEHGNSCEVYVLQKLVATLRALSEQREERLFGHSAVAKRSLRFANANPSRFFGSGATSLPPSA